MYAFPTWPYCCCSVTQLCPTFFFFATPMDHSMLGFPVLHHLLEFAQTYVHWVSDAIQPSHPLSPSSPPAFNLSSIGVFSNESALPIRSLKYWNFSFSISPSNEYSGLISFRIDWFDLLPIQGTLKTLFQHHGSKASFLWSSAFFMVQLSDPYMTTGKTIALTIETFVGKVMSLLFNMLSRFVMTFLPRSKHLLISWLESPSAVILDPKKIKSVIVSIVSPSICREVMEPDALVLVFWMLSTEVILNGQFKAGAWMERKDTHHASLSKTPSSRRLNNWQPLACFGRPGTKSASLISLQFMLL